MFLSVWLATAGVVTAVFLFFAGLMDILWGAPPTAHIFPVWALWVVVIATPVALIAKSTALLFAKA